MALVSVDEVVAYMNDPSFNPGQESIIEMIINGVQQELEMYLGRPVEPVQMREFITATVNGLGFLSVNPVHQILSIGTYLGSSTQPIEIARPDMALTTADRTVDKMPSHTMIIPGGLAGLRPYQSYAVEYIGGYLGYTNDAMRLAILDVSARSMTVHHDDSIALTDDVPRQPTGRSSLSTRWEPNELEIFHRLKRRVIV